MNTKKIVAIIAASALAVLLLAVGIVFALKGIKGNSSDKDNSSDASLSGTSSSADLNDGSSNSANGQDDTQSTVSAGRLEASKVNTKRGKKVAVPIKLSENPGINAASLVFEYDTEIFTYEGCDNGDILDECEESEKDGKITIIVISSGIEDIDKNGTLVTLNFTVKDNAEKGKYAVKLSDKTMIVNADEIIVAPKLSNGEIVVK